MKMDDSFESEIICDIVTAHLHILKRYFSFLCMSLFNIFVLAPGETVQSKMLKPAPFMLIMLMIIVISIVIQSNKNLRSYFVHLHNLLIPGAGLRFSTLADSARLGVGAIANCGGDAQVTQEFQEGLVGIYAMQGRRGNMEDRFSVMQDVPVGPNKQMSFFGVYDGHGGQYVAEYLRKHLFKNTVEKIKQLRSSVLEGGGSAAPVNNEKDSGTAVQRSNSSKSNNHVLIDRINKEKINDSIQHSNDAKTFASDNHVSDVKTPAKEDAVTGVGAGGGCEGEPLMKDDAYNTVNIRKKSLATAGVKDGKDRAEDSSDGDGQLYVDMNKNINYTKLLTDQILHLDRQVVEQCKSNTDLSGSTAVVALLDGELLVVGNVGDSRAVMADDRGRAIPLSFDHKPNQLKERRRIKEAGGFITFTGVWRVAGILATSRALGDFPLKQPRPLVTAEPDILTFSLSDHKAQFVILASDGLWDVLSNEEAVSFLWSRLQERDYGARSLALHAFALGSQDNITVAVLNFANRGR